MQTKMYSSLARSAAERQGGLQSWPRGLGYQQVLLLEKEKSRDMWQDNSVLAKLQACGQNGILMAVRSVTTTSFLMEKAKKPKRSSSDAKQVHDCNNMLIHQDSPVGVILGN
jgi:hypothetical protein